MHISIATVADAARLAELSRHVHQLHLDNVAGFFRIPSPKDTTAVFGRLLAKEHVRAFIASEDDTAVGYILLLVRERPTNVFCMARSWIYIEQISVEPAWQRRGIGRALMQAALEYARELGITDLEVETWAFNQRARAFFQSCGFTPKSERAWMKLE